MLTPNELIFILVISIPFLLIPSAVGWYRGHPRLGRLVALNVLGLPFFGIGWILALIWAVTVPDPGTARPPAAAHQPADQGRHGQP